MDLECRRPDGTFVITLENGWPYHVTQEDELFAEAQTLAEELGDDLPLETPPEPAPPSVDDFRFAIQNVVDEKARERRYDNGNSLASYANSTVASWAAEASTFIAWRDQVWAYAYAALAEVEAEIRPVPSIEELLSELPTMEWPE
jgi:hypothetical protein